MSGLDDLKRFEAEADAAIRALPLANLPARTLLTGLHYFIYTSQHAGLLGLAELRWV